MDVTIIHFKIVAMCFMCTMGYLYLYIRIHNQTSQIQEEIKITATEFVKVQEIASSIFNSIHDKLKVQVSRKDPALTTMNNYVKKDNLNNFTIRRLEEVLRQNSTEHVELPLVTLFTSWVSTHEKYTCHNNTLYNWKSLKPYVQPILFSNERQLKLEAKRKGWIVMPIHASGTKQNVPILKVMFEVAMEISSSTFYAYANGDILFTDSLIHTLLDLAKSDMLTEDDPKPILVVGRRTNVYNVTRQKAKTWSSIQNAVDKFGKLFKVDAEDYFITTKYYPWYSIPDVVIGRPGYDNWLVWNSRRLKHWTIDATNTLLAVHQTTDSEGNTEGHFHGDNSYNFNLLKKFYKRIQYRAGLTTSTQLLSNYDENGDIQFLHRY